jgi:hypothetical protein
MIGTTVKIGFDSSAVGRGMANMGRMLSKGLGRIGTGAAERVGHQMTDLMGRIVMAIPDALRETADWAGNMTDMSTQTGMSVESLVVLEEKLRLAGASANDTSRIISTLNSRVHEATTENGAAAEAMRALGINIQDIAGASPERAFTMIGQRVAELGPEFKGLENIMGDLFGARMGFKLIRFFKTYDESTARAEKTAGMFGKALTGGLAGEMDEFGDALGRMTIMKRQLSSIVLGEMFRVTGGSGGVDKMFDFFDPEKIRPKVTELFNLIGRNLEVFMSQDISKSFGDIFRNIGKQLGEGIKESFGDSMNIKGILGFKTASATQTGEDPIAVIKESNKLLTEIRDKSVAKFA